MKSFSTIKNIQHQLFVVLLLLLLACNKQFDLPPLNQDPEIPVDLTIAELKSRYQGVGLFQTITDDKTISGIVTADDRSGNFYKQIVIQDETSAIPVLLDGNSVYTSYPIGRRVYIKVKGMMLGDYGGTIQLGLDSATSGSGFLNVGRIPSAQFDQFIIKGSFGNKIEPKKIAVGDLSPKITDPLQSMLVELEGFQFSNGDTNKTYADPTQKVSAVNFTMRSCAGKSMVLRNSSFANFAGLKLPNGNGSIVGINSVFNNTQQFFIRDTADIKFNGPRCGAGPVTIISIAELLKFATGDSTIPDGTAIEGTIISDTKNEAAQNYRLQDATGGIQIRFSSSSADPKAVLNDQYKINVGNLKLSVFSGGLQISNVDNATKTGSGATVAPKELTIAQIKSGGRSLESMLVKLKDISLIAGAKTSTGQNFTIKDATGELVSFVRTTSGIVMPDVATGLVGYVSMYQAAGATELVSQLTLRTQADIEGAAINAFNAVYDFALVTSSSGITDPTAPPTFATVTFGNFKAVGVGTNSSGSGRFSFTGWPFSTTGTNDSIDVNKYYEVTLTPTAGSAYAVSQIEFTLQRSSFGIRQYSVRSSIDGYATNLPAFVDPPNVDIAVLAPDVFSVVNTSNTSAINGSAIRLGAAFSTLTTPVTFRFYGYKATGAGGTFSIDNVRFIGEKK